MIIKIIINIKKVMIKYYMYNILSLLNMLIINN